MTEAERLQKVVEAQGKEIKRLRKLLAVATVATIDVDFGSPEKDKNEFAVQVTCTAIGIDEFYFISQMKESITDLISKIGNQKVEIVGEIRNESGDAMTGEIAPPLE